MLQADALQPELSLDGRTAALYRLVAETIPHIVWSARGDGYVDFFNQRTPEYTGRALRDLEGWGWKAILHADDWDRCLAVWTRALQTGERYEVEYRLRRHDGEYRWHHSSAVAVRDGEGRPQRWFGTATDIEDEVRSARILEEMIAERSRDLQQSERRFQLFMDHVPVLAWARDSRLRYVYVNRLFEKTMGSRLEELVGRTAAEAHPAQRHERYMESDLRVQRDGHSLQLVEESAGRRFLKVKFPWPDATGAIGVAGIALDITEQTRLAEQARQLLDRLIAAQESERRRLAGELHDLIGQNLTALGIDLAALEQKLARAGDPVPDARLATMRALVEQTIRAMRGVMTDLRPPALEEFGLVPALRAYAAEFGERTGMSASVAVSGPQRRLAQEAESALFRIVQEAMTNAAKHSGGTQVTVQITAAEGRLRVCVEDDGRGFAAPGSPQAGGGWGLTTMRERAEFHGGWLLVECPGRGTRITVEVPCDAD